jgi:uncharacterized protein
MTDQEKTTLIDFPCDFLIKVIGKESDDFIKKIVDLTQAQCEDNIDADQITTRPSKTGQYIAVSINIHATSQQQLDAIYQSLSQQDDVLMTL